MIATGAPDAHAPTSWWSDAPVRQVDVRPSARRKVALPVFTWISLLAQRLDATRLARLADQCAALAAAPDWIMDGNYHNTYDIRMQRADTLLWLDYPRATCLRRVLLRY